MEHDADSLKEHMAAYFTAVKKAIESNKNDVDKLSRILEAVAKSRTDMYYLVEKLCRVKDAVNERLELYTYMDKLIGEHTP